MTDDQRFDRLARAWLELGPMEAPDRAVAAVLHAVETTPQVRPLSQRLPWRSQPVNRTFMIMSAAAVVLIAVLGGIVLSRPAQTPSIGAPSPSIAASPALTVVPEMLRGRWLGGAKPISGLVLDGGTQINFTDATVALTQANHVDQPLLVAVVAGSADGRLRVTTSARCPGGSVGDYTWTVSPDGRVLTITAVSDPCQDRLAGLPGAWERVGCKNPDDPCLGDLAAGRHESQFLAPRLAPGATWLAPVFGGLTYLVPDGWANSGDWPSSFKLTPSANYAVETPDGPPDGVFHEIKVFTQPAAAIQDETCSGKADPAVERTVDGLISWLGQLPSLATTAPSAITIDGHAGQMVDITLDPSWSKLCPGETLAGAEYLAPAGNRGDPYSLGIFRGEFQRLMVLDLGDGAVAAVLIDERQASGDTSPARFESLVQSAMPIIESFTFK